MTVAKKELHRLVDSLPAHETLAAKRFIEFLLARNRALSIDRAELSYTAEEASTLLGLSTRKLRRLIRESVIPANKERGRWLIKADTLRELRNAEAREFLSHPLAKEDLTEEEKAASQEGWQEHLAGKTTPLSELLKEYQHEPRKS